MMLSIIDSAIKQYGHFEIPLLSTFPPMSTVALRPRPGATWAWLKAEPEPEPDTIIPIWYTVLTPGSTARWWYSIVLVSIYQFSSTLPLKISENKPSLELHRIIDSKGKLSAMDSSDLCDQPPQDENLSLSNGKNPGLAFIHARIATLLAVETDSSAITNKLLYFFETSASNDSDQGSEGANSDDEEEDGFRKKQ
jgi:hypothetical protein